MKKSSQLLLSITILALHPLSAADLVIGDVTYDVGATSATVKRCDTAAVGAIPIESTVMGMPVTGIDDDAFKNCGSVTGISLPNGIESIGEKAFERCDDLLSINLPNGLTTIGDDAFRFCESLTILSIPSSVTSLGEETFYSCGELLTVILPPTITTIGAYMFADCEKLINLTLPDGILSIGDEAFSNCLALESINIPASVTSIGDYVFYDCESMTSIDVDPLNTTFTTVDGVMFSKDLTKLHRFPCGKQGPYTIPTGTLSIEFYAFEYCVNLVNLTIPNTVQTIAEEAFYYSQELTTIDIPDSVTSIGSRAFYSCSGLTSVTIGSGLNTLGGRAFDNCDGMLSFTVDPLNTNFASVDGVLFSNDLTSLIQFPAGRTGIYHIPNGTILIGDYSFRSCEALTGVVIPDSVTTIGAYAFNGCDELRSVTIPAGVTSIREYAFHRCDKLTSISFLGNAPGEIQTGALPTFLLDFEYKARVGATGFDTGYFASIVVDAHLNITSMSFDLNGNLIVITDALDSSGFKVRYTNDLVSAYSDLTGASDVGSNGFMIPAGHAALAADNLFFQLEYDSPF